MHDVFEIAFRDGVPVEAIVEFLSQYFSVEKGCIVSEDDYWGNAWEGKARVGVSFQTATDGLRTNISGVSFFSLDDTELANMAKKGAKIFNSEAVIGDYRKRGLDARGSFLSFFPDDSVWESVDASHDSISDVIKIRPVCRASALG